MKNRKMFNMLTAVIAASSIFVTTIGAVPLGAYAAEAEILEEDITLEDDVTPVINDVPYYTETGTGRIDPAKIGGVMHPKLIELTEKPNTNGDPIRIDDIGHDRGGNNRQSDYYGDTDNKTWAMYGSYYYYNRLTDQSERDLYDALMKQCLEYVNGGGDIARSSNGSYYLPGVVGSDTISYDRMGQIYSIFRFENPQFFFLMINYGGVEKENSLCPMVYPALATQEARSGAAAAILEEINVYNEEAEKYQTEAEKVKAVHDLLTQRVYYNYDILDKKTGKIPDDKEVNAFSQTVYSVFTTAGDPNGVKKTSVCMGYASAFALLCNGIGIDALVMCSNLHAWNRVKINDIWYVVDCTWDDIDRKWSFKDEHGVEHKNADVDRDTVYDYYLRSQAKVRELDDGPAHKEETDDYMKYFPLPESTIDCAPQNQDIEVRDGETVFYCDLPLIAGVPGNTEYAANKPVYTEYYKADNNYTIALGGQEDDVLIYYTVDGTKPSEGQGRCWAYTEYGFTAAAGTVVKAMVVKNPYSPSEVVQWTVGIDRYAITYDLDGGSLPQGKANPSHYTPKTGDILLENPEKPGYSFAGWTGTGINGSAMEVRIPFGSEGERKYTATWTANAYNVVFNPNGGTVTPENKSVTFGGTYGMLPTPEKDNSAFMGWFTGLGDDTALVEATTAVTIPGDHTLYAHWLDRTDDPVKVFVIRLYRLILMRSPDEAGLNSWVQDLKSGKKTGADVAAGFYLSKELQDKGLSNGEFVDLAYRGLMSREADPSGRSYWTEALDSGVSRRAIIQGFIGSAEFRKLCEDYGIKPGTIGLTENRDRNVGITRFTARLYREILGRNYDITGLNYWTGQINDEATIDNILRVSTTGFLNSNEFLGKKLDNGAYVDVLYRAYLGREADPEGRAYWIAKLESGASRNEVAAGFAGSKEFRNIMKGFGLNI